MEQVIVRGGSVSYKGRVISRMQDLPSEAELSVGDPVRADQAIDRLQAQIDALQKQVDQLTASKTPKVEKK